MLKLRIYTKFNSASKTSHNCAACNLVDEDSKMFVESGQINACELRLNIIHIL